MNIEKLLAKKGIKITILKVANIGSRIGNFRAKYFNESKKCHIVRMTYPTGEGQTLEELELTKPPKFTVSKRWHSCIEPRNEEGNRTTTFIKVDSLYFNSETLWWFVWGNKPSIHSAMDSVFRDFELLENCFSKRPDEWFLLEQNNLQQYTDLCQYLSNEAEEAQPPIEKIESFMDMWYRVSKLRCRMIESFDIMWIQSSTGLGRETYMELREHFDNI